MVGDFTHCPLGKKSKLFRYLKTGRERSVWVLVLSLLLTVVSHGEPSENVHTVGISVWTGYPDNVAGFKDAMADAGLIVGKNVRYLYRKSGLDREAQSAIAEEFKAEKVDLVYSLTTPGTTIMKSIIPIDTPIVFSIVTYPADSGLIESFAYSGNNLVGTSNYVPYKAYIRLQQLLLPNAKSVAIFRREGESNSKVQAANMTRLFRRKGLKVIDLASNSVPHIEELAVAHADACDLFMTTTDTLMQGGGEAALIEVARAHNIPILSSNKAGIEIGSTFGPVTDFRVLGEISGKLAAQILQDGSRPTELSSALQTPPTILVNRKSLDRLGLTIPESALDDVQYVDD